MEKTIRLILPYWRDATIAFTVWLLLAWIADVLTDGFISVLWPLSALAWIWLANLAILWYTLRYERNHLSRR